MLKQILSLRFQLIRAHVQDHRLITYCFTKRFHPMNTLRTCILSLTWRSKKWTDLVVALLKINPGLECTKIENLFSSPWTEYQHLVLILLFTKSIIPHNTLRKIEKNSLKPPSFDSVKLINLLCYKIRHKPA